MRRPRRRFSFSERGKGRCTTPFSQARCIPIKIDYNAEDSPLTFFQLRMAEQSFQITVPNNSSSRCFPDNQANHFQVMLPSPITLQGECEAGLVDIQFDNYWLYLEKPQHVLMWVLPENEKIFTLPLLKQKIN